MIVWNEAGDDRTQHPITVYPREGIPNGKEGIRMRFSLHLDDGTEISNDVLIDTDPIEGLDETQRDQFFDHVADQLAATLKLSVYRKLGMD